MDRSAVQQWIADNREQLVQDVMRLVRIRSVCEPDPQSSGAPFGRGCADALDEALAMCRGYGFETQDFDRRCGAAFWPGSGGETIGIFAHLDVVPEGGNWDFPPYQPFEKDGYITGRGSVDNKGPTVAALYALRCLRELGAAPRHSLMLYFGCAEEAGMMDITGYLQQHPAPAFSLVPDVTFPVCYGEKGSLRAELVCDVAGSNLRDIGGGVASNSVPDSAWAVLGGIALSAVQPLLPGDGSVVAEACGGDIRLTAKGVAGHAAFPEGTLNAIWRLARFIDENALASGPAKGAFAFLNAAFADYYGQGLDIAFSDELSGRTTHIGGLVGMRGGRLVQGINVRFAVSQDAEQLEKQLAAHCGRHGFSVENLEMNPGFYTPLSDPAIPILQQSFSEVYGMQLPAYTMGGGTYARKLPRAVGFGPGMPQQGDAPYAGGHQANEGICIDWLLKMIEIYALALPRLDAAL